MSTIGCGCTCAVVRDFSIDRDLARAVAAIVAEPIDIDPVVGRIGCDLEVDRLADIGADLGGKTLDVVYVAAVTIDSDPIRSSDCPASCSPGRSCSAESPRRVELTRR